MEQRYSLDDLRQAQASLLERLHGAETVETTTTEPWWMYLKVDRTASALNRFGDFTSCNIHVVWDTDITDPAAAALWTRDRALEVRSVSERPLLLREAGLPGQGHSPRDDTGPEYTRSSQAAFWRASLNQAGANNAVHLVAFEAIDNQSKRWREFEGNWGLLDPALHPWPAWAAFPDQINVAKSGTEISAPAESFSAIPLQPSNR
jgi:hypothetical protein